MNYFGNWTVAPDYFELRSGRKRACLKTSLDFDPYFVKFG